MEQTDGKQETRERIAYLDYLRVLATFGVVLLHVSAWNWPVAEIGSFEWKVLTFYNSSVRWCVPVFVMISGVLFLGRAIDIKKLYLNHVLKMLFTFALWSTIYYMVTYKLFIVSFDSIVMGYYHLWFVPMMAGLYICLPVIKKIAEDESIRYYLAVAFVLMVFIPSIVTVVSDFGSQEMNNHMTVVIKCLKDMQLWGKIEYALYFVLGYFLHRIVKLSKMKRGFVCALGIAGGVLTILLTIKVSSKTQQYVSHYYENFSFNVFLMSIGVFVLFRYAKLQRLNWIVAWLSKYSFLIYLVHALVLLKLNEWFKITSRCFNPLFSVPLLSLLVFGISFAIAFPLKQLVVLFGRTVAMVKTRMLTKREDEQ